MKMPSIAAAPKRRPTQPVIGALVMLGIAAPICACSDAAVSKAVDTAGDGKPPIVVRTSESAVIVENHAGRPLLDVRVTIKADSAAMAFVHVEAAIDAGVSRELPLTGFRDDENTLLDPRAVPLKQVTVTARDTVAKSYEATVPWMP